MESFSYDGLAISSGGYKGIAMLGAITPLSMYGCLKNVKYYSGCSVGSIICVLLACGWEPAELYKRCVKIKLFNGMSDININRLKENFGLLSNESFMIELDNLILEKRKSIPTLLDFHNEGIYLAFSIADRRSKKEYKLDYLSNPTLSSSMAAMMSSNIPFVFPPIDYKGMKVVDGALANPFPAGYIDNGKRRILGIVVYGKESDDDSFISHFSETMMIQIESLQNYQINHVSEKVDVLKMIVDDIGIINVNHSYETKNNMYFKGVSDGLLLYNLLVKKINKEERKKKRHEGKNVSSENKESTNKSHTKSKTPQVKNKINSNIRIPITIIPKEIMIKCLLSQPLDIIVYSSLHFKDTLHDAIKLLSKEHIERLKCFAKSLLGNEIPVNFDVPEQKYIVNEKIRIRENYSQKIYDKMPLPFQTIAKSMIYSLGKEDGSKIISGVNTIIEGLSMIGIDVFNGMSLEGLDSFSSNPERKFNNNNSKVEILDDDDDLSKKSVDDID